MAVWDWCLPPPVCLPPAQQKRATSVNNQCLAVQEAEGDWRCGGLAAFCLYAGHLYNKTLVELAKRHSLPLQAAEGDGAVGFLLPPWRMLAACTTHRGSSGTLQLCRR